MELLNMPCGFGTVHFVVLPGHHAACRFLHYRGIAPTLEEAFFKAVDAYLEQMLF
jgi:hypothetical protein